MKHIVALSGGKDSTAMAIRLAEIDPQDYIYVCTPTGDEPPAMFEHWRKMGTILGKPILPIMGGTLSGLISQQNALPNWRQRWCTRMLKIEPYAHWLSLQVADEREPLLKEMNELSARHFDWTPEDVIEWKRLNADVVTSYVGLRADEAEREGGDYSDIAGVSMKFPMREWGWELQDVMDYLSVNGIEIPPRTDCLKCFCQRLIEWYEFWRDNKASWAEGERMESDTGHTFRSPGRDTWPAAMKDLRARFEAGDIPRDTRDPLNAIKCRVCRL